MAKSTIVTLPVEVTVVDAGYAVRSVRQGKTCLTHCVVARALFRTAKKNRKLRGIVDGAGVGSARECRLNTKVGDNLAATIVGGQKVLDKVDNVISTFDRYRYHSKNQFTQQMRELLPLKFEVRVRIPA